MDKDNDNDNVSTSTEAEWTAKWTAAREDARCGLETLRESMHRIEEILGVERPHPERLRGTVNTPQVDKIDARDGMALLEESIANIKRILLARRAPSKEAPTLAP